MDTTTIRYDKAVKYYQLVRFMANLFSKDNSTKVGALFIAPNTYEILTLGYNGMPRGINEKNKLRWERPTKYDFVEHAERNAIYNAARSGQSLLNSICIVSLFPCCDCARGIIQAGAKVIVSLDPFKTNDKETIERWGYKWESSIEMFKESGVEIIYLKEEDIQISGNEVQMLMHGLTANKNTVDNTLDNTDDVSVDLDEEKTNKVNLHMDGLLN